MESVGQQREHNNEYENLELKWNGRALVNKFWGLLPWIYAEAGTSPALLPKWIYSSPRPNTIIDPRCHHHTNTEREELDRSFMLYKWWPALMKWDALESS